MTGVFAFRWIVCGAAFLAHLLSTGLQLAYGALHVYALRHLGPSADHAGTGLQTLYTSKQCRSILSNVTYSEILSLRLNKVCVIYIVYVYTLTYYKMQSYVK